MKINYKSIYIKTSDAHLSIRRNRKLDAEDGFDRLTELKTLRGVHLLQAEDEFDLLRDCLR